METEGEGSTAYCSADTVMALEREKEGGIGG